MTKPIAPCLWFDNQAEEAVNFYTSIFKNSKVTHFDRFENAGGPNLDQDTVFIEFEINGQPFQALDGGPEFKFSEAISFTIECADQEELDYYWEALTRDGGEGVACGWLKDKYGVSWQVVPTLLNDLLRDPDKERSNRVMKQMFTMVKLDLAPLQAAADQ